MGGLTSRSYIIRAAPLCVPAAWPSLVSWGDGTMEGPDLGSLLGLPPGAGPSRSHRCALGEYECWPLGALLCVPCLPPFLLSTLRVHLVAAESRGSILRGALSSPRFINKGTQPGRLNSQPTELLTVELGSAPSPRVWGSALDLCSPSAFTSPFVHLYLHITYAIYLMFSYQYFI